MNEKAREILDKLLTGDYFLKAVKTKQWVGTRLIQHGQTRESGKDKTVESFEAYTEQMEPIRELTENGYIAVSDDGTVGFPSMKALVEYTFQTAELPAGYSLEYDGQTRKF